MTFTIDAGDLDWSPSPAQLHCFTALTVVWIGRLIGKDFVAEGLKIQFALPCRAGDAFPVSLIHDSICAVSTPNTLMTYRFGDADQDRRGVEASSGVTG